MKTDQAYQRKIFEAVSEAIVEASRSPGTNVSAMRNAEIYGALIDVLAMFVATSNLTDTRTKTRAVVEDFSKKLRRGVAQIRAEYDREGFPFEVRRTGETH